MYSLFTHKGLKEPNPFQITETVKDYINKAEPKLIIISPGYLSTTQGTTDLLLNEILSNWFSGNKDRYVGITAGMNGINSSGKPTNLQNHWNTLKNYNINIIYFCKSQGSVMPFRTNRDHKKMIFFADFLTPQNSSQQINCIHKNNLDNFIKDIRVTAVATGSSNFSKTTYLGNSLDIADKGESDIFMYSKEKKGKNRKFHNNLVKTLQRIYENNSNIPDLNDRDINSTDLNDESVQKINEDNSKIPGLNDRNINSTDLNNGSVFIPPMLSQNLKIGNIPIKSSSKISSSLSDDERYLTWMLYATLKDQLS